MKRTFAVLVVAHTLLSVPAHAGELQRAAADLKSLVTAPLHWRAKEWKRFGEGTALVLAVGVADKQIEDAFQRNRSSATNSFAKAITPFGGGRALQVSALLFGAGALFKNPRVEDAGRDSLEAELWAAGVITPIIKREIGRARPFVGEGPYSLKTDQAHADAYQSFPSGHATNAFAAATAIAGHYDNWIVPTIVYTLATGVAVSRVNDHVHWPSDVVAGALIGRAVARGIVTRHLAIVPAKRGIAVLIR